MAEVIDGGAAGPDHPAFTGGVNLVFERPTPPAAEVEAPPVEEGPVPEEPEEEPVEE